MSSFLHWLFNCHCLLSFSFAALVGGIGTNPETWLNVHNEWSWVFSDAPLPARLFFKNLIIMMLRECAVVTVARMEQIKLSNHVALDIFRYFIIISLLSSGMKKTSSIFSIST